MNPTIVDKVSELLGLVSDFGKLALAEQVERLSEKGEFRSLFMDRVREELGPGFSLVPHYDPDYVERKLTMIHSLRTQCVEALYDAIREYEHLKSEIKTVWDRQQPGKKSAEEQSAFMLDCAHIADVYRAAYEKILLFNVRSAQILCAMEDIRSSIRFIHECNPDPRVPRSLPTDLCDPYDFVPTDDPAQAATARERARQHAEFVRREREVEATRSEHERRVREREQRTYAADAATKQAAETAQPPEDTAVAGRADLESTEKPPSNAAAAYASELQKLWTKLDELAPRINDAEAAAKQAEKAATQAEAAAQGNARKLEGFEPKLDALMPKLEKLEEKLDRLEQRPGATQSGEAPASGTQQKRTGRRRSGGSTSGQ